MTFSIHDREEIVEVPDDATDEFLQEVLDNEVNNYLDCSFERIVCNP